MLSSCVAPEPSREFKAVPAGYLYEGGYINVRAPSSSGWHLLKSSRGGMGFSRSGDEPNESFGAQVLMFPLEKTQGKDEFVSLIKKGAEADAPADRFTFLASEFKYTEQRGYACVWVTSVVEDKKAQTSPTRREVLLLQAQSLYCRHPVHQDTGFSAIYSHRGKSLYSNLDAEAQEFINGVQVPGHP
jgi:hypothetical protein